MLMLLLLIIIVNLRYSHHIMLLLVQHHLLLLILLLVLKERLSLLFIDGRFVVELFALVTVLILLMHGLLVVSRLMAVEI